MQYRYMRRGAFPLLWLLATTMMFFFTQETSAAQVDVDRKEQTALENDNVTYMCRVAVPLQYCRVEIPGLRSLNLNKLTQSNADVSYYGEGLDAGQCGFTIHRIKDQYNGEIKCTLGIASEAQESVGTMNLVVARAPKLPELDLTPGTDQFKMYKVDDILLATCMVREGRPAANISWFLGEDLLDPTDLSMPTVMELAKENLLTTVQNVTRRLRASDNGKFLRCVAYHPAYPGGRTESKRRLDVKYAPLPQRQPIEEFGYEIGKSGVINVTVEANPKPTFMWTVAGEPLREGSNDNTGIMVAEHAQDLGNGRYLVSLRIARISKTDTEKEYILEASNDLGRETYKVKISTNPEPKGYEIGVAAVIGIVAAVLLIVLSVGLLVFAKLNGRWCFSGTADSRYIAESSDTESADVRPKETKRRLPSIQLTSAFFKKKHGKVTSEEAPDAPQASTASVDETDDDKLTVVVNGDDRAKNGQDVEDEPLKTTEKFAKGDKDKALVYAELDLVRSNSPPMVPVVKGHDDKTEYAEIVYTPAKTGEGEERKQE